MEYLWQKINDVYRTCILLVLTILALNSNAQLSTTTSPDVSVCPTGSTVISTSPSGGTSYSYSWSPATGLSSSTVANPTATPATTTKYYVTVTDIPTSNTVTDSVTVTVQNSPLPLSLHALNQTICQGDSLFVRLANDVSCAGVGGSCGLNLFSSSDTVGAGAFSGFSQFENPFFKQNFFFNQVRSNKRQFIYRASEFAPQLYGGGPLPGPVSISGIKLNINNFSGTQSYSNFVIRIGCTNDSVAGTTFKTGLTTVYGPTTESVGTSGWKTINFNNSFAWDGQSNLVVEFCYTNAAASNGTPGVFFEITTDNMSTFNVANSNVCNSTTGTAINRRINMGFVVCDFGSPQTISSANVTWSPAGSNGTTGFWQNYSPTTSTSVVVTATDADGCSATDTLDITVAPDFTLTMPPDTVLCDPDTFNISLTQNSGVGASFKWMSGNWIENDTLASTRIGVTSSEMVFAEVSSAAGCVKTDSFFVGLTTPVELDLLTEDTTICLGDSLPTLVLTTPTACYVQLGGSCSSTTNLLIAGTSAFPSGGVTISPFDALGFTSTPGQKKQMLLLASEIQTIAGSNKIASIGFNVQSITGTNTQRNGFTIRMSCTSITEMPFGFPVNFVTGAQTVYTPKTITVATGWNDFIFDNPFIWDGVSNVLVEICWENSSSLGTNFTTMNFTNTTFRSNITAWNASNYCNLSQGNNATFFRPEMRFGYCGTGADSTYKYAWTPSLGVSDDTIAEPLLFPAITTKYFLTATDPLTGCADTDSIEITTAQNFQTTVTDDTTLCEPDTVNLNVSHTSTLPVTFNWQPASAVSNSTIANPTAVVSDITTVVSEVESSDGCIRWDTVVLSVFDQIDLDIIAPAGPFCQGDSIALSSEAKLSCGPSNSVLCVASNILSVGTPTVTTGVFNTTPFVASDLSGKKQYMIRKSELNALGMTGSNQLAGISFNISTLGKDDYQNFVIKMGCTSANALNSTFKGGTSVVYEPKDVTLVSGVNWFDFDRRFNWDGESNLIIEVCYLNNSTGVNSDIYYTQPNNPVYSCTTYDRGNSVCASGTGTAYNRRPVMQFKHCAFSPTNFQYDWQPNASMNDPGLSTPKAKLDTPGVYILNITDVSTGCPISDTAAVAVNSFELAATPDTSLCSTLGFPVSVVTNSAQPDISWSPSNQVTNDTIANPLVTVDNAIQLIVEVTDTSGCSLSDTVFFNILPQPTATASPTSVTVCRFESVQLTGGGGTTYSWSPTATLSNPNVSSPIANPVGNTVYYLTVQNSFGCEDKDSVIVNVFPSPILDLGPDTSYCNGGFITLNAGGGFTSYEWQDGSSDSSLEVSSDGVYHVRVEDNFNCTFIDTVIIEVAPAPVTNIRLNTDLCVGDSVILDALNDGASYLWSTGETTRTIIVKNEGFYFVEIDDGRCIGKDSTIVTTYNYPVTFLPETVTYCENEFPFGITLRAGGEEYRYEWDNGQVTNQIIADEERVYTVVITNGDVCSITKEVDVKYLCEEKIFVPNSFTPNSDWNNDVFTITAENLSEFEFLIFNRWGEIIYKTKNTDFEWDGTQDGKDLPAGIYMWRMEYKFRLSDGSFEDRVEQGSLNLLR